MLAWLRNTINCGMGTDCIPAAWLCYLSHPSQGAVPSRAKAKLYYAAEGAFYTASVAMLLVWEERRRDFAPMLAHHIVSVALIGASYLYSCATWVGTPFLFHSCTEAWQGLRHGAACLAGAQVWARGVSGDAAA